MSEASHEPDAPVMLAGLTVTFGMLAKALGYACRNSIYYHVWQRHLPLWEQIGNSLVWHRDVIVPHLERIGRHDAATKLLELLDGQVAAQRGRVCA